MAKTVTVTLDGTDYALPKLNLGQLEEVVSEILGLPKTKVPFAVLRLAFARLDPPVDVTSLTPNGDEVVAAAQKILVDAGLAQEKVADAIGARPGEPAPAAAG